MAEAATISLRVRADARRAAHQIGCASLALRELQDQAVCHSLDSKGRTLCGAEPRGLRAVHPLGTCAVERHKRCATCDSLNRTDLDDDPSAEEAA